MQSAECKHGSVNQRDVGQLRSAIAQIQRGLVHREHRRGGHDGPTGLSTSAMPTGVAARGTISRLSP